MYTFLSVVYVIVCSFLIMVVLLQQGRGGGMGSLGGGSQTVFGGSGAGNVLTRLTTGSAILFMTLSATLAWLSSSGDSALEDAMEQREELNHDQLDEALHGDDEGDADEGDATPESEGAREDEAPPSTGLMLDGLPSGLSLTEVTAPLPMPDAVSADELEAAPSTPTPEAPTAPPPSAL